MALPPRPKSRVLVRRAIVASVLASAGCDQGAKPSAAPATQEESVPPQVAPLDAHEEPPVPPQVAPPQVAPDPPPQIQASPPPQVAHSIAPQVAHANGISLVVLDESRKPLENLRIKVTLHDGETVRARTSAGGRAYVRAYVSGPVTVTVEAAGYQSVDEEIGGGLHPSARIILKKKKKAR